MTTATKTTTVHSTPTTTHTTVDDDPDRIERYAFYTVSNDGQETFIFTRECNRAYAEEAARRLLEKHPHSTIKWYLETESKEISK